MSGADGARAIAWGLRAVGTPAILGLALTLGAATPARAAQTPEAGSVGDVPAAGEVPKSADVVTTDDLPTRAGAPHRNGAAATAVTEAGRVRGAVSDGVAAFLGIPFAAPPVGELRWLAPAPPAPWDGVRPATEYGADCMQVPFAEDAAPLRTEPAEDCLYLNLWRPAGTSADAKLPVLVWIYGGGFVNGGSSPAVYEGGALARHGLVVVSFNYRLGRFGFFAHPALTAAGDGPLANYGLLDQVAALGWVQRNVAAFGGDPQRVTVAGESAGGTSVLALTSTPLAAGLFQQAVVMSGGGRMLLGENRRLSEDLPDRSSAESVGVDFARGAGVPGAGPRALAALRALPAETVRGDLNLATRYAHPSAPTTWVGGPVVDGTIVRASPEELFARGEMRALPTVIGTTGWDVGFVPAATKDDLFARFGRRAAVARAAYDPDGDRDLPALSASVGVDHFMHEPARFVATQLVARGVPAYLYRFSYVAESKRAEWPGAPHARDIPYFFATVEAAYGDELTAADRATARAASGYLAAFVRRGLPAGPELPTWPVYDPQTGVILDFTHDRGPVAGPDPWRSRLDLVRDDAEDSSGEPPAAATPDEADDLAGTADGAAG